ncbi:MAG: glycosyltransferase family 4 protein [Candidatus Baltobacteraceae bacterium]
MHVAVDAFNLAADRRGMGRHVRAILSRLPQHGVTFSLICRTPSDAAAIKDIGHGRAVLALSGARRTSFDAAWFPWNGMRFDLEVPAAITIHDLFAIDEPHRNLVARFREQRPILRGARKARAIATVSHWSARQIAARFAVPAATITVIPPILESFWQPVPEKTPFKQYVLFVAGPEPRKNAAMFFEAYQRSFAGGDVVLVIAGTLHEDDERALESKHFRFERVRPNDTELRELYSHAIAVAVPSRSEGYGLVALEAMACGAAVIASDVGALPEACEGAALLLGSNDPDEWAFALLRTARDHEYRRRLQQRSLERVSTIDREAPARVMAELLLSLAPQSHVTAK